MNKKKDKFLEEAEEQFREEVEVSRKLQMNTHHLLVKLGKLESLFIKKPNNKQ